MTSHPIYVASFGAEAVAATTAYVCIDLSDTTNYPHAFTNELHLLGMILSVNTASDGIFDFWFGVVTEVDASNGSVDFFDVIHCEARDNATDDTGSIQLMRDYTLGGFNPDGVNLLIESEASTMLVCGQTHSGNAAWQTDTGLASPAGAAAGDTGKPGAGDLVLYLEEATDSGTIDFSATFFYHAI